MSVISRATRQLLISFLPFGVFPVSVHHMAVNKIQCINLQYKHLYVCAIQYLQCIHQGSGNIFLSVFTFRHIVYFNLQNKIFFSSDLHWNTSISFQCSTVHVVHSYDVKEQKTFPQKQRCSLQGHILTVSWPDILQETLEQGVKKMNMLETKILKQNIFSLYNVCMYRT